MTEPEPTVSRERYKRMRSTALIALFVSAVATGHLWWLTGQPLPYAVTTVTAAATLLLVVFADRTGTP